MAKLEIWMAANKRTVEDVAEGVGVHVTTISRLLPGQAKKQRRRPSLDLAERVAVFTNGHVTANDFMDDDVPRTPHGSADKDAA